MDNDNSRKRRRPALKIEPTRSRKKADEYARHVLENHAFVCDRHILETLRLWRFHEDKRRTNVFPPGAGSVLSDTLGATTTRSGKVRLTNSTTGFPSVFALFARWLRCHQPGTLSVKFPFTSIDVNYAYAAALHRDSSNTAASMTKAFGSFTHGGKLLYFPEDDGTVDPAQLSDRNAVPMVIDTRECLCLFDAARAHGVQPFSGEFYNVVFYTQQAFASAPAASLKLLRELGATVPDEVSVRYYESLLAPAKGYVGGRQRSITTSLLGKEDNPQVLTWRATTFNAIGENQLDLAISYVICPTLMETLCSTCQRLNRSANRSSAWRDTIVECPSWRPLGARAHMHYKLWSLASAVAVSEWQFRSCSFLVYSQYKPWKWRRAKGGAGCIWHEAGSGHWLACGRNPLPFSNAMVMLEFEKDAPPPAITFGICDTNCHSELSKMCVERQFLQARGPYTPVEVQLNMCCLTWWPLGGAVFQWNDGRSKRQGTTPISESNVLLSFGVPENKFEARIGNTHLGEDFKEWAKAIDVEGQHFAFIAVESETRPRILAKPMLSTKG